MSMNNEEPTAGAFPGALFDRVHPDQSSASTKTALVIRFTCVGILLEPLHSRNSLGGVGGGIRLWCLILTDVSCHLPIIPAPLPIDPLHRSPVDPLLISPAP